MCPYMSLYSPVESHACPITVEVASSFLRLRPPSSNGSEAPVAAIHLSASCAVQGLGFRVWRAFVLWKYTRHMHALLGMEQHPGQLLKISSKNACREGCRFRKWG